MANVVRHKKSMDKLKGKRYFYDKETRTFSEEPPEKEYKPRVAIIGDMPYYNHSLGREFGSKREERNFCKANGFIQKN